jgi:hypothetical protein
MLTLLTWTIWRAPTNVSKWRMGFNTAFKGLTDVYPEEFKNSIIGNVALFPRYYDIK